MATDIQNQIDKQLEDSGIPMPGQKPEKVPPSYKMFAESRIPVSKSMGKLWESRVKQSLSKREDSGITKAWDEAIRYFENDQSEHREGSDGSYAGNRRYARFLGEKRFSETENIVYSNARTMVPMLFAKNPVAEFTTNYINNEDAERRVRQLEKLVNTLATRRHLNLKKPLKRCVLAVQLTNGPWIEVGYTKRAHSSEQAYDDILTLSEQLAKAKTQDEIRSIEGKLQAIEEKHDVLQPAGPWLKYRRTDQIIFDACSEEEDGCDGSWMACCDYIPTSYLLAVYATDEDTEKPRSIFKPTHVLRVGKKRSDAEDEVANFSIFQDGATYEEYGYSSQESYDRAQTTKVWKIWDKTTRRVYLFNANDFSWPIWVWDDPYKLERFYPYHRLVFDLSVNGNESVGEVSYYLDQQDAINEINSTERTARSRALGSILYNSDVITDPEVIRQWARGESSDAVGIALGADSKLTDHVMASPHPALQFAELFDKSRKYMAIDRISSANAITRGEEFKTNTTNKAISQYNDSVNVQLDDRLDTVEDFTGDILWSVAQMCLQFMEKEQVASLIGDELAEGWETLQPEQYRTMYDMRITGGSTQKPTSRAKKQEAMEVGQILGQFSSVPAAVLVMLRMMQRAFDEMIINQEDWDLIMQQVVQATGTGSGGEGGGGGDPVAELTKMIQELPPEAQKVIGNSIAKGAPLDQTMQTVIQQLKGGQKNG